MNRSLSPARLFQLLSFLRLTSLLRLCPGLDCKIRTCSLPKELIPRGIYDAFPRFLVRSETHLPLARKVERRSPPALALGLSDSGMGPSRRTSQVPSMLGPSQSEAQKPTQRPHAGRLPGAAATHGRPRRHSLLGPRGPAIDKENAPTATKEAGAGTKQKPAVAEVEAKKKGAPKALDVSVAVKPLTRSAATGGATSTPLARKSTNRKAFQSSISPLVHFDDPAAVASTFSTRSATAGRSASGATAASQQSPHQSPPPQKSPVHHQPSLAAGPVVPAFYNQTSLPPSLTNSGLGLGPAGPYYLPSFDLPFLQQSAQGHYTPSSPGTPGPPTPMGPTSPAVSTGARSLYPSSLGLGHPYLVAPSVSSSLSLSSVPSIFSTPGSAPESRNTSFGSVAPEATPLVYPIPYAFVVNDAPPRRSSRATIRQRLEGGEIIDSKGSVKFFDVERASRFCCSVRPASSLADRLDRALASSSMITPRSSARTVSLLLSPTTADLKLTPRSFTQPGSLCPLHGHRTASWLPLPGAARARTFCRAETTPDIKLTGRQRRSSMSSSSTRLVASKRSSSAASTVSLARAAELSIAH